MKDERVTMIRENGVSIFVLSWWVLVSGVAEKKFLDFFYVEKLSVKFRVYLNERWKRTTETNKEIH